MTRIAVCAAVAASWLCAAFGAATAAEPDQVRFLLPSSRYLVAFAPLNLAESRGYFAKENVKIEFVTVRGGAEVATQVGAGNALIGGGIGDTSIIVRANGVPIRTVALLGGGTLTTIVSREDGTIRTLADLKGHRVGVQSFEDTTYYALLGNLASVGLQRRDVDIQALGPAGIWQLFAAGRIDAMSAVPDWIVEIEAGGTRLRRLSSVTTFPSMAQALIASDRAIAERKPAIAAVVRATLHALDDITRNPDAAAADLIAFSARNGNPLAENRVLPVLRLYAATAYAGQTAPGASDPARIEAVQDLYLKAGIIAEKTAVRDLYTNEFVDSQR